MLQWIQSLVRARPLAFLLALGCSSEWGNADESLRPGLKLTFIQAGRTLDVTTRSHFALYVPEGSSATPFLAGGPFVVQWEGDLSVDWRSQYRFHARFNGGLKLQVNGASILDTNSLGTDVVITRPIRLNKGTNSIQAVFTSPAAGDAMLRMEWAERRKLPEPIPSDALSHSRDPELERWAQIRAGRALVIERRCLKCHLGPEAMHVPELLREGPSLVGIGSRRKEEWMARWIADPKAERGSARMPKLLDGGAASKDAGAIAAYLATLTSDSAQPAHANEIGDPGTGKQLFERLQCAVCHIPGSMMTQPDARLPLSKGIAAPEKEIASSGTGSDPVRIALAHVADKFTPGALVDYLLNPSEGDPWTRMPDYGLQPEEAIHLAAYLMDGSSSELDSEGAAPDLKQRIEQGKHLIQTAGCLNCHDAGLENRFSARPLAELNLDAAGGCLSAPGARRSRAPDFGFSDQERAALRAFLATDRESLARLDPAEFAERETQQLRCAACHEQVAGLPRLELLGRKLKPEWSAAFIAGAVGDKPRPWLEARMPAFKSRAAVLAAGMAMLHGYPAATPAEPPVDIAAAEIGRKLISAQGGFACVACHAVGESTAQQVLDHPGINLAYSSERLLADYFERWLLNPLAIDPTSKMPAYFDEQGRSPLTEFYEGDGKKQIAAMWEYLRQIERKRN